MPTKAVTMEAVTMRDFSGLTLIEGTAAFTVTGGNNYGCDYGPENLLDGMYSSTDDSNYSKWVVDDVTTGCLVEFNTAEPVIPKHYTLISSDNKPFVSEGCYPICWTIEASASGNDGWTTIATESYNDTMYDELACHSYIFDFNNPDNNTYQYFRFTVTRVQGWQEPGDEYNMGNIINWLELSEMQMYVRGETLAANENEDLYWTTYYNSTEGYRIVDENAYAYTAEYDNANSQLMLHKLGKVIPAGTAVIIVGGDNSISMTPSKAEAENTVGNNLDGVDERTEKSTLGTGTFYVLSKKNSDFGFFEYTAQYMPAHKAYLLVNGDAAQGRGLTMVFEDEATGIISMLDAQSPMFNEAGAWFTINGVKLAGKPTVKGLYIHNGRKEVLK